MGGKSKKTTIGYKYFMGLFMGLCRGPVDAIRQIRVGDKTAWTGHAASNSTITINKPDLFGGEEQEGGIDGTLQIMLGAADQPRNDSLAAMLGGLVSAFRGVTTTFFDGLVCAMSPYPKEWSYLVQKTKAGWHQDECWYPAKCEIVLLDGAVQMLGSGWEYCIEHFTEPNTVWNNFTVPTTGCAQGGEMPFDTYGMLGGPYWTPARSNIWLRRKMQVKALGLTLSIGADNGCVVWVDGVQVGASNPTNANIPSNENNPVSYEFGAVGTVEVLVKAYAEINNANESGNIVNVSFTGGSLIAMNPAHILRRLYTDPSIGRGLSADLRLDEESWMAAADTFFNEGLGLCMKWSRSGSVANFAGEVINHAGAAVYTSRKTGKIVLKAIRGDYALEDLPLFTPDTGLLGFDDDVASAQTSGINEIVVNWTNVLEKTDAAVREKNLGAIMAAGGVAVTESVDYPGIPTESLARRIARRDLKAKSGFIKRLTVRLDRRGRNIMPGHVFRVSDPSRGIANMVLRAGRVEFGTITDGTVTVTALQDVFGLPATVYREPEENAYIPPDPTPRVPSVQSIMEAPYRELAQVLSAADLAALPAETGFLTAMAVRPAGLADAFQLMTRVSPADYTAADDRGMWCPGGRVAVDVGPLDTSVVLAGAVDLSLLDTGTAALIGDEIVRIDAVDPSTSTLTIARGCVDTVPVAHAANTAVLCYDTWGADDQSEYIAGVTVSAKLLTRTGSGSLPLQAAPEKTTTFASRAARPYPPAQVQINGSAVVPALVSGEFTVSWLHRHRVLQADQLVDVSMASIGPEPGTTYTARFHLNGALVDTVAGIAGNALENYSYGGDGLMRVEVAAMRDGLESWQAASSLEFNYRGALTLSGMLPAASAGALYSAGLTVSGGTPPYQWSLGAGAPAGLAIDSDTGLITGVITVAGDYSFDVIVTDAKATTVSSAQSLTVGSGDPHWDAVVLLMHFDGNVVDERGGIFNEAGTVSYATGRFGQAMNLTTGDSGAVESAVRTTLDLPGDFTAEGWMQPTGAGVFINRFDLTGGPGWQIELLASGKLSFWQYPGGYIIHAVGPNVMDGLWHHVAATREGSTLRMFVDGVLVGTVTTSANYTSTVARLSVGYQAQGSARYPMRGSFDEVRITKGLARYTTDFTVPDTPFSSGAGSSATAIALGTYIHDGEKFIAAGGETGDFGRFYGSTDGEIFEYTGSLSAGANLSSNESAIVKGAGRYASFPKHYAALGRFENWYSTTIPDFNGAEPPSRVSYAPVATTPLCIAWDDDNARFVRLMSDQTLTWSMDGLDYPFTALLNLPDLPSGWAWYQGMDMSLFKHQGYWYALHRPGYRYQADSLLLMRSTNLTDWTICPGVGTYSPPPEVAAWSFFAALAWAQQGSTMLVLAQAKLPSESGGITKTVLLRSTDGANFSLVHQEDIHITSGNMSEGDFRELKPCASGFVATGRAGLLVSTNDGQTWAHVAATGAPQKLRSNGQVVVGEKTVVMNGQPRTQLWSTSNGETWTKCTVRNYRSGTYRHWRLRATGAAGEVTLGYLAFFSGAAKLTGYTKSQGAGTGLANVDDADAATFWSAPAAGVADGSAWVAYDFGSLQDVTAIELGSPSGGSSRMPTKLEIEACDDGLNWWPVWFEANLTWSAEETKRLEKAT